MKTMVVARKESSEQLHAKVAMDRHKLKREILAKNYRDRQAARPASAHAPPAITLSSGKLLDRVNRKISPQQALSGAKQIAAP